MTATGFAQQKTAAPAPQVEAPQDLVNRLTPQQKQQFDDAVKAFSAQRYADALAAFKNMLDQLPGDAVLSKFAGEAALNAGDKSFALKAVRPIAQADPNDWQAAALLTRACAESGDAACRDSGIAHMLELQRQGVTPENMQQYVVEHVKVGANTLVIWTSLVPWGHYKIYNFGQVAGSDGKVFLRITLESNDADQGLFAQEHPKEAAKGIRSFSLDAYRDTGLNANGQATQTHYTYKFFVGQPSYETIRDEFVKITDGKSTAPISSRTNLTAQ
ncbi:MAG TPA: tetratricopeptide repeat protein [Terriglobales bacterium]